MKGGNLYKAKTDVSAGIWDENDWEMTDLVSETNFIDLSSHITSDSNLYYQLSMYYCPMQRLLYYKSTMKVRNQITNISYPTNPNFATFDQYLGDLIGDRSFEFAVYDVGKVMSANIRVTSSGMFIKVGEGYKVSSDGYVGVYSPICMYLF